MRRVFFFLMLGVLSYFSVIFGTIAKGKEPKPKGYKLDPKAVAANELLDKKFLKIYRTAISQLISGQLDAAIATAQSALSFRPNSGRIYALIGAAYKRKKDYAQAITNFQQAVTRFDDRKELFEKASALYNIAFCYELMNNSSAAIAAWQIFINLVSTSPHHAASLAFARKRIQDLKAVVK